MLLSPPPADPLSPSTQPVITITQSSPSELPPVPVEPPQAPQWTTVPRPPTPPIPWSQHTCQYSSMELYQEPQPEPTQELVDSDMSSPGPSPVISQPPSHLEPPPSPMLRSSLKFFIPLVNLGSLTILHDTPNQLRTIPDHHIPLCTPEAILATTCPAIAHVQSPVVPPAQVPVIHPRDHPATSHPHARTTSLSGDTPAIPSH